MSLISSLVFFVIFLFSGCAVVGAEPESFMRPPKATGEQAGIQQELEKYTKGNNYTLKYPGAGDYRSAIVMMDLTGNDVSDALIFYRLNGETGGTRFMLLVRESEQWRMKGDFEGPGTDIDKVCFGDLDGDGIREILIGWKITRDEKKLTVHKYMPDQSQEQFLTIAQDYSYAEFFTGDFTRDNVDDVIAAYIDTEHGQSWAELLQCVNQRMNHSGRIALTEGVVGYAAAQTGKINASTFGVVLDGILDGSGGLVTDIVFCDAEGNLVAPQWDPENTTARALNVFSADFNKDGLIDIPFVTKLPMPEGTESTEDSKKQALVTVGKTYTGNPDEMFETVIRMFSNPKEGYYFLIPNSWIGNVAAELDEELRTVTFYELGPMDETTSVRGTGEELLRIQVFATDDFFYKVDEPGVQKIFESNGNVYTVLIGTQSSMLSVSLVDAQHDLRPILD